MAGKRRLFCEFCPAAYRISVWKCRALRRCRDICHRIPFAGTKQSEPLPELIYSHRSLIRRRLGNVNMRLQENKAENLRLAAPKVSGILIKPGETFSFWRLVGLCTRRKGYREGLTIGNGKVASGIGGGMCQFTNLIHWMVLHSPLTVTEYHHHDGYDLFPDFGRQLPFGIGTSIFYNYLDYRFKNATDNTFQLIVHIDDEYLRGELRTERPLPISYHIRTEDEYFYRQGESCYRHNRIYRDCIDKYSGKKLAFELVKENHAKVLYDPVYIPADAFRTVP